MIQVSADALLAIINDILDFSKIEAGKLELEAVPVRRCDDLVDDVIELFLNARVQRASTSLRIVDPGVPRTISGRSGAPRQVISNLVNNALKFTERGHVQVAVVVDRDARALRITVSDTGIGIAQDKIGAVFVDSRRPTAVRRATSAGPDWA